MSTVPQSAQKFSVDPTRHAEGFHTVTPHLVCAGAAKAIDFYKVAFGAVEIDRLPTPDGRLAHAAIRIGDSIVMVVDEFPEMGGTAPVTLKGTPVLMHLYVKDADAVFAQATQAGASVRLPLQDMFWGDRYGQLADPFGHVWSVATHRRDLTPEEVKKNMSMSCG